MFFLPLSGRHSWFNNWSPSKQGTRACFSTSHWTMPLFVVCFGHFSHGFINHLCILATRIGTIQGTALTATSSNSCQQDRHGWLRGWNWTFKEHIFSACHTCVSKVWTGYTRTKEETTKNVYWCCCDFLKVYCDKFEHLKSCSTDLYFWLIWYFWENKL